MRWPRAVPKTSVSALAAHCYSNYCEQLREGQLFRVEGAGKAQEKLQNDQSSVVSLAAMKKMHQGMTYSEETSPSASLGAEVTRVRVELRYECYGFPGKPLRYLCPRCYLPNIGHG